MQTAFGRGDVPYVHNDIVYIGRGLPPVKLRSKGGEITTAGHAYVGLLDARGNVGPEEHLNIFPRNARVTQQGRQDFAENREGHRRLLRTFQPGTGEHAYTKHGKEFFDESRNFIVHIPVKVRWRRKNGDYSEAFTHQANGERETIPLSLEQMQEMGLHLRFPELENRGGDPAVLRRGVEEYLRHLAQDPKNLDRETGELIVGEGSAAMYTIVPSEIGSWAGWQFDEEVLDEHTHKTEVFLNRPLSGLPRPPDDLWNKEGLHKEAWIDYRSEGKNCVAQQLAICLSGGRSKLTIQEIEMHFDELLEELWPGGGEPEQTIYNPFAKAWQPYFKRGKTRSLEWLRGTVKSGHFTRDSGLKGSDFHAFVSETGYEGFFSNNGFSIVEGQVSFSPEPNVSDLSELSQEEREDMHEQRSLPKAPPYTDAGWRQIGVASSMVVALCERLGRKVRIIHNDRCIWDFTPEKKQWGEMVVLSVWGDHAFFYKDKLGAQLIRMAPVSAIPECKLACRVDYERTAYGEMEPWDIESGNKTFRADRIGEVIEQLREAKRHFKVKYRTANLIASVRVGNQRIRSMPASAELLNSVAEALAKRMPFVYCGEAEGGFATRFMEQVLSKRRPSHVNREAVLARQKGICGKCGDHLEEFEVHHERSLRDGGGSNIENLKALCISCHALETERQGYASRHSFWSELSPDATEMWNETPKPAQLLWGSGSSKDVECLDVRACRPSALLEARLPVFGPADDPEPYVVARFSKYDYFWVKRRFLQDEQTDLAPYDGEHLYCAGAVKYMLDKGVIKHDNLLFGLSAIRWISSSELRRAFELLKACVSEAGGDELVYKKLRLSWIGVCNRTACYEWTVRETTHIEDMGGRVSVRTFGEGIPLCKVATRVIDSRSAFPIGLIALQMEQCYVDIGMRQLRSLGATILGVRVDGIFFDNCCEAQKLENERFNIKKEPASKVAVDGYNDTSHPRLMQGAPDDLRKPGGEIGNKLIYFNREVEEARNIAQNTTEIHNRAEKLEGSGFRVYKHKEALGRRVGDARWGKEIHTGVVDGAFVKDESGDYHPTKEVLPVPTDSNELAEPALKLNPKVRGLLERYKDRGVAFLTAKEDKRDYSFEFLRCPCLCGGCEGGNEACKPEHSIHGRDLRWSLPRCVQACHFKKGRKFICRAQVNAGLPIHWRAQFVLVEQCTQELSWISWIQWLSGPVQSGSRRGTCHRTKLPAIGLSVASI